MQLKIAEIAAIVQVTKRTIQRRAITENWPYTSKSGLGGQTRYYSFYHLPEDIRVKFLLYSLTRVEPAIDFDDVDLMLINEGFIPPWPYEPPYFSGQVDLCSFGSINPEACEIWIETALITTAHAYWQRQGVNKTKGFDAFCAAYNDHTLTIDPIICKAKQHLSRITLLRWESHIRRLQGSSTTHHPEYKITTQENLLDLLDLLIARVPALVFSRLNAYVVTQLARRAAKSKQ